MGHRKTLLFLGLILLILLLGIVYAAINATLSINTTATVSPDQANFKVAFSGTPTYTGNGTAILNIVDDLSATMQVTDLKSVGDKILAEFTIMNSSVDLIAYLTSSVSNINTEYFRVSSELSTYELAPRGENSFFKSFSRIN